MRKNIELEYMSQEKRNNWKLFVIIMITLVLGFVVGSWPRTNQNQDKDLEREQEYKRKEAILQKTIDSLQKDIQHRDSIVSNIQDSIKNLKPVYIETIEKIKQLPTTSGVEYLNKKLREYEEREK